MKNYNELLKENEAWAKELFAKMDKKLSKMAVRSRDKIPDGVDANGMHVNMFPNRKDWWTNGFWGGLNFLMYDYTKNEEYLKTAKRSVELMDETMNDYECLHHDVGFMWHILAGADYKLTGDEKSKNRNLYMAASLASRFVLSGNFIRAWNGKWEGCTNHNWTIIDCLMNLPILYFASDVIEDDRFKQIAMAHADMALRDHLRPDGSVNHIVEHDRETGALVKVHGGQGYSAESSWSRGCAWAVYGFTISYIHTGEKRYLDGAKSAANYYIANICDDWLPRIDFRAPSTPVYYDAAGACCAAAGLIELAKVLPENEGGMYMHAAINMLKAMEKSFLNLDENNDHLVDFGSGRYPVDGNLEKALVHKSIIYSDYFYVEAILKLIGGQYFPW